MTIVDFAQVNVSWDDVFVFNFEQNKHILLLPLLT